MAKQAAGRKQLGKFAPQFAALNDDVLFGEVWAKENELSAHDRSMITIACLMTSGDFPQLKAHLQLGKEHGRKRKSLLKSLISLFTPAGQRRGLRLIWRKKCMANDKRPHTWCCQSDFTLFNSRFVGR